MELSLEVTFTPADFDALRDRDLSRTVCVVFDVLRATTSMTTALANGAAQVLPVREISQALGLKARHPDALLAGERHGARIRADQTGGVDFDLGNSPREFTPERVRGRTIIMSTTNGTRALQACAGAKRVFAGSLVGFGAFAKHCSLFPMGASVLNAFERELKDFRVSKGTLHFPLDKPLPAMLIKKIVKARIAQNELKSQR